MMITHYVAEAATTDKDRKNPISRDGSHLTKAVVDAYITISPPTYPEYPAVWDLLWD